VHRHGSRVHRHAHVAPHRHLRLPWRSQPVEEPHDHSHRHDQEHGHGHGHGHGHTHGLVDPSIVRSRDGVRTVAISLGVLGITAAAQVAIFTLSGSIALLADLIHNFGDALTAIPLGIAFFMRSYRAEKLAGLFVVAAIFISPALPSTRRSSALSTQNI
jgi:hypothetical protein